MLTEKQENRVDEIHKKAVAASTRIEAATVPGAERMLTEIIWLAEKLKEINNEASKYSEELYKANKELADYVEHYEG